MKYKLVIFDMDGTFVDSYSFHGHILYEFLRKYWKDVSYEEVSSGIGTNARAVFEDAQIPERLMGSYFKKMNAYYENESLEKINEVKLVDGIKELLLDLKSRGIKRAVVTNTFQKVTDGILSLYDLSDKFDLVLGANLQSKDKTERCRTIEKELGVAKSEILFVGDSEEDMKLANTMGYHGCFVDTKIAWYKDREYILSELKPAYVTNSIKRLTEIIQKHNFSDASVSAFVGESGNNKTDRIPFAVKIAN